jgi:hypothetical protein
MMHHLPLAARTLHNEGKVGRVLVVGLDAQQGDGPAAAFNARAWASNYDLYEADIVPARKEPEDVPLPDFGSIAGAVPMGERPAARNEAGRNEPRSVTPAPAAMNLETSRPGRGRLRAELREGPRQTKTNEVARGSGR